MGVSHPVEDKPWPVLVVAPLRGLVRFEPFTQAFGLGWLVSGLWPSAAVFRSAAFFFCRLLTITVLMISLVPKATSAHPAQFTTLQVTVDPTGEFHASLNIDILAYALGETSLESTNEELQALLDGPRAILGRKLADAGDRFRREVVVRTDAGDITPSSWTLPGLPEVDAVLARKIQPRILMPGEIDFSGTLPADAHTLSIRLPYILGDTMQVYELPNGDSDAAPVPAGDYSEDIHVVPTPPQAPANPAIAPGQGGGRFLRNLPKALGCALFVIGLSLAGARLFPRFGKEASGPREK
jgi:hypothetical protein